MADLFVPVPAAGERWIVGAVIHDGAGRIFVQRRSDTRSLFPAAWDLVGGHLEDGESILECLAREVKEETGWSVASIATDLGVLDWTGNDGVARREIDYLIEVNGDLLHPQLEQELHHDPRWVDRTEALALLDGTHQSDGIVRIVVERAFEALAAT